MAQLPVQPHRQGAAGRPPAQGRRLGARAGRAAGLRRVLHRDGVGRAAAQRAAPRRLRR